MSDQQPRPRSSPQRSPRAVLVFPGPKPVTLDEVALDVKGIKERMGADQMAVLHSMGGVAGEVRKLAGEVRRLRQAVNRRTR